MEKQEKAVITVVGKDMVGILAKVSGICAEKGVNSRGLHPWQFAPMAARYRSCSSNR